MSGRKLCKSVGWVERSISGAKPIIRRVSDYSDLLYRLKFKDGRPGFVYFLLEHKRAPKRSTALQLLRYRVQIWEKALAQGIGTEGLPPIMPVVLYQGDTPWPYGETFQQLFHLPAPLAPYTPEFRYALCDLTGLADTDIRGAVLLRVTLWIMKPIADAQLAERLPKIVRLLRELSEKRTLLDYLETLLRYLTTATDTLSERDIGQALNEVLPLLEEKFMPTLAEKWLEQGRQEARAEIATLTEKWLEAGERRVLLRQLELRFGSLPEAYRERIATADPDTLLVWGERVLSAHQLEEIFAP